MKRLFYDSQTGEITYAVDVKVAPQSEMPYIDTDQVSIRICDWLVINGELQPNPNPPTPTRR